MINRYKRYRVTFTNDEDGGTLFSYDTLEEAKRHADSLRMGVDVDEDDIIRVEDGDAETIDEGILYERA